MYRASQRNGSRIQNPGAFGALTRPGRDKYVLIHLSRRRQWHPTPVLLPGKSHGWSLVGYSPWGRKELDMTERVPFHFSLSCIGEGNGNPLQHSCLENPYRQRSLVGYSPWGRKESDMTEQLHFHFSFSCIREGDGNPLQCSCLENLMDRGA